MSIRFSQRSWAAVGLLGALSLALVATPATLRKANAAGPGGARLEVRATSSLEGVQLSQADEDPKESDATDPDEDLTIDEERARHYVVPEGSNQELFKFVKDLKAYRPTLRTSEEQRDHLARANEAILAAAERILNAKPDADDEALAQVTRFQALYILRAVGDPTADGKLLKLSEKLKKHKRADVAEYARLFLLSHRVEETDPNDVPALEGLVDELATRLKKGHLNSRHAELARSLAKLLEENGHLTIAAKAYRQFADALAKDEKLIDVAVNMEGSARRLSLLGQPLEITGTLAQGGPFTTADWQGKVIFIDFWATWCTPCVAEMPNLKRAFEKYHSRGLEIVGVCLDDDAAEMKQFLQKKKLPWQTLASESAEQGGFNHPMAVFCGVQELPSTILIDAEGKVVALNLRGRDLLDVLEKMLGKNKPATKTPADDTKSRSEEGKTKDAPTREADESGTDDDTKGDDPKADDGADAAPGAGEATDPKDAAPDAAGSDTADADANDADANGGESEPNQ